MCCLTYCVDPMAWDSILGPTYAVLTVHTSQLGKGSKSLSSAGHQQSIEWLNFQEVVRVSRLTSASSQSIHPVIRWEQQINEIVVTDGEQIICVLPQLDSKLLLDPMAYPRALSCQLGLGVHVLYTLSLRHVYSNNRILIETSGLPHITITLIG